MMRIPDIPSTYGIGSGSMAHGVQAGTMTGSQLYYLVRSRTDGQYLVAKMREQGTHEGDRPTYILTFTDHADALSYLNTHAGELAEHFAVEAIAPSQLSKLMQRWGYTGIGMVNDPLIPEVEFLERQRGLG